jgi:hypothetical protein
MRITLIHPPDGMLPTVPYASMPTLTACLAARGHEVTVRDVNLELLPRLLRRAQPERGYSLRAEPAARRRARPALDDAARHELWRVQRGLAVPRGIYAAVAQSFAVMQDR